MSRKPRVLIPWFPGTNCHEEMAYAFKLAGSEPKIQTLREMEQNPRALCEADLIGLAGGFSYGDHFGSGRIAALDFSFRFRDLLLEALKRRTPILGVCNGYQILTAMGLLPGDQELGTPSAALDFNVQGRFEHWHNVTLVLHQPVKCVWTQGLAGASIRVPVGHGEGVPMPDPKAHIVATYGTYEGCSDYPVSPNGSRIAGTCDPSGLVMGMMPHPERRVEKIHGSADGLLIFQSGVNAVR
jgi:phosphoribosylformylglycinamidine (FGAM) synthase-like amidotransferase family enzyme